MKERKRHASIEGVIREAYGAPNVADPAANLPPQNWALFNDPLGVGQTINTASTMPFSSGGTYTVSSKAAGTSYNAGLIGGNG